uniref:Family with sequence similarity 199, X-linked n=1 Tax=Callorhinchus milii TaxID=7868 RepID=A0A4W3IRF1_CALMI
QLKKKDKEGFQQVLQATVNAIVSIEIKAGVSKHSKNMMLSQEGISYITNGYLVLIEEAIKLDLETLKQVIFKDNFAPCRIPERIEADFDHVFFKNRRRVLKAAAL